MRKILCAATIALVCVWAGKATADVLTGQKCLEFPEDYQRGLLMFGVINGFYIGKVMGEGNVVTDSAMEGYSHIAKCIAHKTVGQYGVVLKKWLDENPEHWDVSCTINALWALNYMCDFQ